MENWWLRSIAPPPLRSLGSLNPSSSIPFNWYGCDGADHTPPQTGVSRSILLNSRAGSVSMASIFVASTTDRTPAPISDTCSDQLKTGQVPTGIRVEAPENKNVATKDNAPIPASRRLLFTEIKKNHDSQFPGPKYSFKSKIDSHHSRHCSVVHHRLRIARQDLLLRLWGHDRLRHQARCVSPPLRQGFHRG